jgi:hypothetical protein
MRSTRRARDAVENVIEMALVGHRGGSRVMNEWQIIRKWNVPAAAPAGGTGLDATKPLALPG